MTDAADAPPLTRGHKKKARTRQLLLDTALEVLAEEGEGFSVADIAARAGVSNGTFYNYFGDRDALIGALIPAILDGFVTEAAAAVQEPDPARRFALITARALDRAAASPDTVRVALRLEAVQAALVDGELFAFLRGDLAAGHAAGRFADAPDTATLDVVVGTLLVAARRIVGGETSSAYRVAIIGRLLRSLGMPAAEAAALAADAVSAPSR